MLYQALFPILGVAVVHAELVKLWVLCVRTVILFAQAAQLFCGMAVLYHHTLLKKKFN